VHTPPQLTAMPTVKYLLPRWLRSDPAALAGVPDGTASVVSWGRRGTGSGVLAVAYDLAGRSCSELSVLELCAGAGGQAIGLEWAGFAHRALVDIDPDCCATLRLNRPAWRVIQADLRSFSGAEFRGVDLVAAGLPCPPFSIAGKQLGEEDERDLFPAALRLVEEIRPRALMVENVKGLLGQAFRRHRERTDTALRQMGYEVHWRILNASDYGVPQLRPRLVLVALQRADAMAFAWPGPRPVQCRSVGEALLDLMAANGWERAEEWARRAASVAPTLVGGSRKHGGPDLGPTRARRAWAELCVDGLGIADEAPSPGFRGLPRLTLRMAARVQGFPDDWRFAGGKTAAYRQIGNAFPPPVGRAVAESIRAALLGLRAASQPPAEVQLPLWDGVLV